MSRLCENNIAPNTSKGSVRRQMSGKSKKVLDVTDLTFDTDLTSDTPEGSVRSDVSSSICNSGSVGVMQSKSITYRRDVKKIYCVRCGAQRDIAERCFIFDL